MKNFLLAVAVISISTASVNAQEKQMHTGGTTFSIAGNVGSGTGSSYKLTTGGDLQAEFPGTTGLKFTGSAGYQNFGYEYNVGSTTYKSHRGFIPLLAGAKFSLGKGLYGHGQLGYSFATTKTGNDNGDFSFAPSIGYGFGKNIDLSAKYLSIGKVNGILARLAYNF